MEPDLNVLYCDDNRKFFKDFKLDMEQYAPEVHTTSKPSEALKIVTSDHVGTVVVDIRMAKDGIDLASQMVKEKSGLSVVFFTAHTDELTKERARNAGLHAAVWVDKTGGVKPLVQTVERIIDEKLKRYAEEQARTLHLPSRTAEKLTAGLSHKVEAHVTAGTVKTPGTHYEPAGKPEANWDHSFAELKQYLAECLSGYSDVAIRHTAWNRVRRELAPTLWRLAQEANQPNPNLRLIFQFVRSVEAIEPKSLTRNHLRAAVRTISLLAQGSVTDADVISCRDVWHSVNITTTPSLQCVLDDWQYNYDVAEISKNEDRSAGNIGADGADRRRPRPKKRN